MSSSSRAFACFVLLAAVLAGCSYPGEYPVTGDEAAQGDAVHSMSHMNMTYLGVPGM